MAKSAKQPSVSKTVRSTRVLPKRTSVKRPQSQASPAESLFGSFFQATRDYLGMLAIVERMDGSPAALSDELKKVEALEVRITTNPSPQDGAECFELIRQLVYREVQPAMNAEIELKNAKLHNKREYAKNNGGYTHDQKKVAFIYFNQTTGGTEQRIRRTREHLKEQWGMEISKSDSYRLLREHRKEGTIKST